MRPDMNQQNERCTDLYEAILRLENLDECIRFFDDLCAVTELRTMEQVLQQVFRREHRFLLLLL